MPDVGFELLEHPADVGIRSWGPTPEAAFEQAAWGLVELLGVKVDRKVARRRIELSAPDVSGLLVDFLNEIVFLLDSEGVGIAQVGVARTTETELEADVWTAPLDRSPDGTVVKAATYHRLRVEPRPSGGVEAQVFLDV
jgi:SHS2 domain-containing protein